MPPPTRPALASQVPGAGSCDACGRGARWRSAGVVGRQHLSGCFGVLPGHQHGHTSFAVDGQCAALHFVDDVRLDADRCEVRRGDLGLTSISIGRHDYGLGVLVGRIVGHGRERTSGPPALHYAHEAQRGKARIISADHVRCVAIDAVNADVRIRSAVNTVPITAAAITSATLPDGTDDNT